MVCKAVKSIEVIFNRSKLQWIKNVFRKKSKRFPSVVTFTGFTEHRLSDAGLLVVWGSSRYFYPMHQLNRIKYVTY